MLGKLMKYDLRSCMRRFGPLWVAALALSVLNGLSFRYVLDAPGQHSGLLTFLLGILPVMLLFGLFFAIAILSLVFICERFYKGLLGSEGYLMFTLPAPVGAHIASKGLTALILEIISGVVALASGALLVTVYHPEGFEDGIRQALEMLRQLDLPASLPWLIAEGLLLGLVTAAAETLRIYLAISLGHLAKKHRVACSLLSYVGIGIVLNILFMFGVNAAASGFRAVSGVSILTGLDSLSSAGAAASAMGGALFFELLLGTVYFLLSRWILKHKLNLE